MKIFMKLNYLCKNYLKKRVSGYVSRNQKSQSLKNFVRLDLGENLLGCSPMVLAATKNITKDDLRLYADPSGQNIKNLLAILYYLKNNNISLASSSNEIIDYLPKMVLESKDRVLIIVPTFFRFIESSLAAGGMIIYQKLEEKNNFQIDKEIIERVIRKINKNNIKLVWLCQPNNPTGGIIDFDLIKYLITKIKAMVILDEAFWEYYDLTNKNSGVRLIHEYQNLIVLRTLSKAYGLAGLRFGYCIGHKKTIETIEHYRNTLLMTSGVVQKLASAALEDQKWLKKTIEQTNKLKKEILSAIKTNSNLHVVNKSQANVYLLKHKKIDLYQALMKQKIITADFCQAKGIENKNYVRITVANKKINQKLLSCLNKL